MGRGESAVSLQTGTHSFHTWIQSGIPDGLDTEGKRLLTIPRSNTVVGSIRNYFRSRRRLNLFSGAIDGLSVGRKEKTPKPLTKNGANGV